MAEIKVEGVSVVAPGRWNPAILNPSWLASRGLIDDSLAEAALGQQAKSILGRTANAALGQPGQVSVVITSQNSYFSADWLEVQATPVRVQFLTSNLALERDLMDVAKGVFDLLPQTPVSSLGINSHTHFEVESAEAWHAFGDMVAPKDLWEDLVRGGKWISRGDSSGRHVGLTTVAVTVSRDDPHFPGGMNLTIQPSNLVPNGVYIATNAHFVLTGQPNEEPRAEEAATVLAKQWDRARAFAKDLVQRVMEKVD